MFQAATCQVGVEDIMHGSDVLCSGLFCFFTGVVTQSPVSLDVTLAPVHSSCTSQSFLECSGAADRASSTNTISCRFILADTFAFDNFFNQTGSLLRLNSQLQGKDHMNPQLGLNKNKIHAKISVGLKNTNVFN